MITFVARQLSLVNSYCREIGFGVRQLAAALVTQYQVAAKALASLLARRLSHSKDALMLRANFRLSHAFRNRN
jgi:hypothetical protein